MNRRKSARSQITRLVTEITNSVSQDAIVEEDIHSLLDRLAAAKLELKEATDIVMISLVGDDNEEKEWDTVYEYDSKIATSEGKLKRALIRLHNETHASNSAASQSTTAPSNGKTRDRLPKMQLKTFTGELKEWLPFWEQFEKAVHLNTDLEDHERYNYLENQLRGKAKASLAGLSATSACYQKAISMLKEEYGSTKRLIDGTIREIIAMQHIKQGNDATRLRELVNKVTAAISSLEALKVPTEKYAVLFKSVLLNVMPESLRLNYLRNDETAGEANDQDEIFKIMKHIKKEVAALEYSKDLTNDRTERNTDRTTSKNDTSKPFATSSLLVKTNNNCFFCRSTKHQTSECDMKMTLIQKKEILRKDNRCFRCTKPRHSAKKCKGFNVKCHECGYKHATTMCDPEYRKTLAPADDTQREQVHFTTSDSTVQLQTTVADIGHPEQQSKKCIRVLLDGGSQRTFIKECVSHQMRLPVVGVHKIAIMNFGCEKPPPARLCRKVRLILHGCDTNERIEIVAIEVPSICLDEVMPAVLNNVQLSEVRLSEHSLTTKDIDVDGISLLIGSDYYWKVVTGEIRRASEDLVAVHTKIGWTMQGPVSLSHLTNNCIESTSSYLVNTINKDVDMLWNMDALITKNTGDGIDFTEEYMERNVAFEDGRFNVKLPWVDGVAPLDSNFATAHARLASLTRKLTRQGRFDEYNTAINEYIQNGIAEEVSERRSMASKLYYMPHRAVYRADKESTKVRIVFDASSSTNGLPSLNDQLKPGSNMIPDIFKVLLNFRKFPVAATADVEKAFLQIVLHEDDRDVHRFLWYKDGQIATFRIKRLTFGITSSPFILHACLKKHFRSYDNECARVLEKAMYVDETIVGGKTSDEIITFHEQAKRIFADASMNLRKWRSNDITVRKHINDAPIMTKVLGVKWNLVNDTLSIEAGPVIKFTSENKQRTKRSILQCIARLFDPMGMAAPFTVILKILLQELWKLKLGWEEKIPEEQRVVWDRWCEQAPLLECLAIRRYASTDKEVELHIFADASPKAYGAVAYVKQDNVLTFFIAKNRVAPLKLSNDALTLPKLELTAALIAARIYKYCKDNLELQIKRTCLWTDSAIALQWITGNAAKWQPYVQNRVLEIQSITSRNEWRHCPGVTNPADLLTRGISTTELNERQLWYDGPTWLLEDEDCWPTLSFSQPTKTVVACLVSTQTTSYPEPLFDVLKYSSMKKLLNVTMLVFRFISGLRKRRMDGIGFSRSERSKAKSYWVQQTQRQYYPTEMQHLGRKRPLPNSSSLFKLNPMMDEHGVMRLDSRLQFANIGQSVAQPMIFPKRSHLAQLLVIQAHKERMHAGVNCVIAKLREEFWIIQVRQLVKSILARCANCRRLKGKPMQQISAPLPTTRLIATRPFETTGVDFAGPLYTEDGEKTYIVLFTCATTRAVHLELAQNMLTETFILALRRFIARRGVPSTIISDNAKTFKRSAYELKELCTIIQRSNLEDELNKYEIRWQFIAERAPWWGGFWERIVRTVKYALKSTLFRKRVKNDELQTVLTEVEACVNSRPLTYISDEEDAPHPLAPSDFLIGAKGYGFPVPLKTINNRCEMVKLWKNRETLVKKFWQRWKTDYLLQLRSANLKNGKLSPEIKNNDVMLLADKDITRLLWKLVRVTDVYHGRD